VIDNVDRVHVFPWLGFARAGPLHGAREIPDEEDMVSKVSIQIEHFHPWPNHAGLFLAEDEGLFRDDGIDVEVNTRDPLRGSPLDHLLRGEVDFCIDLTSELLHRRHAGARVCGIAALNQDRLDTIITLSSTGVRRPRDLAGKSVGVVSWDELKIDLLSLITADGGDASLVTLVETGYREPTAQDVRDGLFDASYAYGAWEGVLYPDLLADVVLLDVTEFGGTSYQPYMVITTDELVTRNPVLVKHVLMAARRGYDLAMEDPEKAARTMQKVIPYFPEAVIDASCRALVPKWGRPGEWGTLDFDRMTSYAAWLHAHQLADRPDIPSGVLAPDMWEISTAA
jgi:NitT/TauT family transport system substrate-binding protein